MERTVGWNNGPPIFSVFSPEDFRRRLLSARSLASGSAATREAREVRERENVNIQGKEGERYCLSFAVDHASSGNERRIPFFDRAPREGGRVSARSFCTPLKLHSRCRKKKLRYTTCKCILNVTVNCPYSKAPLTHAICREKKYRECGRERMRDTRVRWSDWLCVAMRACVCGSVKTRSFALVTFFPGCKIGKNGDPFEWFWHAYDCYVDRTLTIITIMIMIIISIP